MMGAEMACEMCDGLGCCECQPDLDLSRPNPEARAVAALQEAGRVVVKVWCGACTSTRTPVALVHRSSMGLVFAGSGPPVGGDRDAMQAFYRLRWARRLQTPLVRSRVVVLLEHPNPPPEAWCANPEHGRIEPVATEIVAAATKWKLGRRPQRVTVHPVA